MPDKRPLFLWSINLKWLRPVLKDSRSKYTLQTALMLAHVSKCLGKKRFTVNTWERELFAIPDREALSRAMSDLERLRMAKRISGPREKLRVQVLGTPHLSR